MLSEPLLRKENERLESICKMKIENADWLNIMTDGWTNTRGEGVVNFVVSTPEPIFLKSVEPGVEKEDANYMFREMKKVIKEVGVAKTTLIMTDNAAVMRLMWKKIREKYPHIFAAGCAGHVLNLLVLDLMKLEFFKLLWAQVVSVIKLKNKHVVLAVIMQKQKEKKTAEGITSLKLPAMTRWGAACAAFKSVKKNLFCKKRLSRIT